MVDSSVETVLRIFYPTSTPFIIHLILLKCNYFQTYDFFLANFNTNNFQRLSRFFYVIQFVFLLKLLSLER